MARVIDLTYEIEEGMLTFAAPWHTAVSVEQMGRLDAEGRETRKLVLGSHTGTHVDAPSHFIKGGISIDKIPPEKLIGGVTILDFSHLGENEALTKEMLAQKKFGQRVIFKFGWGKHWNTRKFYSGYPFFSREAAELLVDRKVELIGMDTPSPDDSRLKLTGDERDSPMHKIILGNGIINVEYLANLGTVKEYEGWNVAVMPLKIKGSDGAPARVLLFK